MCSLSARGLWIELCGLMHEAKPYGHLLVNGHPVTDTQLAAILGCQQEELSQCMGELENAGVFSRNAKGVVYSRRMTRDHKKASTARKNGKKGGNPTLSKQTTKSALVKDEEKPQTPDTRCQTPNGVPPDIPPTVLAVDEWNTFAAATGLPGVQKVTKARDRACQARLRDCGGLDGWRAALEKIRGSPFLMGENDRGWKANFDFLVREKNFVKLMEDGFEQRKSTRNDNPAGQNGGVGPGIHRGDRQQAETRALLDEFARGGGTSW